MNDDLRKLAEAATPGPWQEQFGTVYAPDDRIVSPPYNCSWEGGRARYTGATSDSDARFIAAANPQAILALLADRDRLQAELDACNKSHEAIRGLTQDAFDDANRLQAENERLREALREADAWMRPWASNSEWRRLTFPPLVVRLDGLLEANRAALGGDDG